MRDSELNKIIIMVLVAVCGSAGIAVVLNVINASELLIAIVIAAYIGFCFWLYNQV